MSEYDDMGGMAGFDWKTARYESAEQEVKRLRAELADTLTSIPQMIRAERERWRVAIGACDAALAQC